MKKNLILIDELARTTNPEEGRIIIEKVMNFLGEHGIPSFITTHYNGVQGNFRRLRVKGLIDDIEDIRDLSKVIDYSLVETSEEEVPKEALKVAKMLGIKLFI